MTILDDARPGMNPDIRPQDDLFGHVNGTWLAEAEIPSDRAAGGPFVMLADAAEQHVREIIEDCAAGRVDHGDAAQAVGEHRGRGSLPQRRERRAPRAPPHGPDPLDQYLAEVHIDTSAFADALLP